MRDFEGAVAVVTGAAGGIGAALARELAGRGARLLVADVVDAAPVADEINSAGGTAAAVVCDVGDAASVEALAEEAYGRYGSVDLLCANAGVVTFAPLLATPVSEWERAMRVNFFGVLNSVSAFVPRMLRQEGERHVLLTASGAGLLASNVLPTGAYSASKFAAVGFGEALRLELAPAGIGVTILCPGSVRTGILDTATYAEGATHLKPAARGAPTPGREHVRRMDPAEVARLALEGIQGNEPYVITHPEMQPGLEARLGAQVAACGRTRDALGLE